MVHQSYKTSVGEEYVIRGNAALIKCNIPSFVADFVRITSWETDTKEKFYPEKTQAGYGNLRIESRKSNIFFQLLYKLIDFFLSAGEKCIYFRYAWESGYVGIS